MRRGRRPLPSRSELLAAVGSARAKWGPPPAGLSIERPGPDRESVWDYPRPPRLEAVAEPVRIVFGGRCILESAEGFRMLETAGAPVYFLPAAAFVDGVLRGTRRWTVCEWKGVAVYFDIMVEDHVAPEAAYGYPEPLDDLNPEWRVLANLISVYPGAMAAVPGDGCYLSGERARPQPGGYYGGWVLDRLAGPIKGAPGTEEW